MGLDIINKNQWTCKYRKTYKGKKSHKISEWRTKAHFKETQERFNEIFDLFWYATKCELCDKEFTTKNIKVADHEHLTGHFRNIVCNKCNNQVGKVDRKRMLVCLEIHRFFNNHQFTFLDQ